MYVVQLLHSVVYGRHITAHLKGGKKCPHRCNIWQFLTWLSHGPKLTGSNFVWVLGCYDVGMATTKYILPPPSSSPLACQIT